MLITEYLRGVQNGYHALLKLAVPSLGCLMHIALLLVLSLRHLVTHVGWSSSVPKGERFSEPLISCQLCFGHCQVLITWDFPYYTSLYKKLNATLCSHNLFACIFLELRFMEETFKERDVKKISLIVIHWIACMYNFLCSCYLPTHIFLGKGKVNQSATKVWFVKIVHI